MKVEMEKIRNNDNADGDPSGLVKKIESFLSDLKENGFGTASGTDTGIKEKFNCFKAVLYFEDGCEMENIRAFAVVHNLDGLADELIYYPQDIMDNNESAEIIRREGFHIYIKTDRTEEEIRDHLLQTVFLKDLELTVTDEDTFADGFMDKANRASDSDVPVTENENIDVSGDEDVKILHSEKSFTDVGQKLQVTEHHGAASSNGFISVSVAKLDRLDYFREKVLPYLSGTVKNRDLRIWSAGCSTGQEPYTLAMIIADYFNNNKAFWDTKILATDISEKVLSAAIEGIYDSDEVETLPSMWRINYFQKLDDGKYIVSDNLKKEVIFRRFNLMEKTFPFRKKFHTVFCRNVMKDSIQPLVSV